MIIYKITCKITDMCYIGQTIYTLKKRWHGHCAPKSGCVYLNNAIQKYGRENFKVEEIDSAETLDSLNEKEIFYILKFNSLTPNGYNLNSGGKNSRLSPETRIKISESLKGRIVSPETRRKISESLKGENNPSFGKKASLETKRKLSKFWKGREFSQDHRKKLSRASKGKNNANFGKKASLETRNKRSESMKKYWENKRKQEKELCS